MGTKLEDLNQRLSKLEEKNDQEILTLIEVLSNAAFFGDLKKAYCGFAENGQCSLFVLAPEAKNRVPVISECRIQDCSEMNTHCHIELSDITCAFCQNMNLEQKYALQIEKKSQKSPSQK